MSVARRRLLAGLCATPFARRSWAAPTSERKVVSLADIGGQPGSDAAPLFREALLRLGRGGGVLHVPAGIWRFAQTDGAAVEVSGIDDLTIEGHGAILLFNGRVNPFVFTGCHAPLVVGLAIDWTRPPFSQGEVVSVGAGHRTAELQIDGEYPVDGGERVGAVATYERATGLMARRGLDAYDVVDSVASTGAQRLRLDFNRYVPLRPGDTVVLRHATYGANALSFFRCSNVVVEEVTIRTAPGMGIYADHCQGASVRRLEIAPPPGRGRLMTTTADGVHFNACGGKISVTDCLMAGMGDDCVNIHGKYFRIARRVDARTIVVAALASVLAGPVHSKPDGDRIEIVSSGSFRTNTVVDLVAAEAAGDGLTTLHFGRDLSSDVAAGDYVFDAETRSQALVSDCHFPGNRARGVLAHSNAVIERCRFSGQTAEAVLLLPDTRFMEGPAAERVVIRDNDIVDPMRLGGNSGAIRVDVGVGGAPRSRTVNRDIAVMDNRFSRLSQPALLARSTAGLVFAGNRIGVASSPAIILQDVQDVQITHNVCSPAALIAASAEDRARVRIDGNVGLS